MRAALALGALAAAFPLRSQSLPSSRAADARNGTFSGTVRDGAGEAVPLARLVVRERWSGDVVARGQSDASGTFHVARIPHGRELELEVRAAGHAARSLRIADPLETLHETRHDVVLRDAGVVRGRVLAADGAAVAGAVIVARVAEGELPIETTSDDAGRYELAGVPLGATVLAAWRNGLALTERRLVLAADAEAELRLAPGPAATLELAVHGPADAVAAARVWVGVSKPDGEPALLPKALSAPRPGADGRIVLRGLPAGRTFLAVEASGCRTELRPRRTDLEPGSVARVEATLARFDGVRLTGRIVGPDRQPVAGASLWIGRAGSGPPLEVDGDLSGGFDLAVPVATGEWLRMVSADPGWVVADETDPGSLASMAGASEPLVVPLERSCSVRGRVVDAHGDPVADALVRVTVPSRNGSDSRVAIAAETTGTDGTYAIHGVCGREDDLAVEVRHDRGIGSAAIARFTAAGQQRRADLKLAAACTLSGVAREDGKLLPGAFVTLYDDTAEKSTKSVTVVERVATTRDGRFAFRALPPGGYRVVVAMPAGGTLESGVVELEGGRKQAVTEWRAR